MKVAIIAFMLSLFLILQPTRAADLPKPEATQGDDPNGMVAFPDGPAGFNTARDTIPHGEVKVVEYDSKALGTRRQMRVYTPPGYTADRKYPVLYLLHGLGNTSTEWTQRARAPQIVDNLLADGKIKP